MSRITFLLPTCEPDTLFTYFLPTVNKLKNIKNLIEFNICFQPPYTNEQIDRVIQELDKQGFKYNYIYKDYEIKKPFTPLVRMRNDCALLSPDAEFYCLLDDDMSFEDESCCNSFIEALTLFDNDNNLGVISLFNLPCDNWRENFYSTNSGLIYRGGSFFGFKGLMPENLLEFKGIKTRVPYEGENLLELFGGFQDKFCAMCRLATGLTGLTIHDVKINHVENRKLRGAIAHGWDDAKYKEGSIALFITKYFNENFLIYKSLTLFDKSLDKEIYPYKYDTNGNLKPEYNIYCYNGIKQEFYDNFQSYYKQFQVIFKPEDRSKW